jgi:ATP-GRASP peptide maturase of grasp-with-spasm system
MILILSNSDDESTHLVIQWLNFLEKKIVRINRNELVDIIIDGGNIYIEVLMNNELSSINLKSISSFWYRRGNFTICEEEFFDNKKNDMYRFMEKEHRIIKDFIHYKLRKIKSINTFKDNDINKLIVLDKAKNFGLEVPMCKIYKSDSHMKMKLVRGVRFITKPIWEVIVSLTNSKRIDSGTFAVDSQEVNSTDFNYSLFQEEIEKEYEVRSFFFFNTFYSMAIFSQASEKTKVDFRNYDERKPNRMIPYKLPFDIESKLKKLMKDLNLDSGSIDLIRAKHKYYFLEVNPVGQFGMVSIPCNYFIEKHIAEYL